LANFAPWRENMLHANCEASRVLSLQTLALLNPLETVA